MRTLSFLNHVNVGGSGPWIGGDTTKRVDKFITIFFSHFSKSEAGFKSIHYVSMKKVRLESHVLTASPSNTVISALPSLVNAYYLSSTYLYPVGLRLLSVIPPGQVRMIDTTLRTTQSM